MGSPKTPSSIPASKPVPATVPDLVGRLLDLGARTQHGAPLDQTLERMLDAVVELEDGAAAGVRIAGEPPLLVWRTQGPAASPRADGARMFPAMAEEISVELPGEQLEGRLHFAVEAFTRRSADRSKAALRQAAAVIALTARAMREEHPEAHPSTDKPVESARDPLGRAELEQLQQLEKLATLGQTASQIVHEMNNPLTAIVAYADYLSRRLNEGGDERELDRVQRIQEAADRLQRFCRDLTTYSRPEAGGRAPVDLHAIIDRALSFCVHALREAEVDVERTYRDIPLVRGLDSSLTQVFVNLFTNAGHAMSPGGGTLRVETRLEDDHVVVGVHDEGHGIDAKHLRRIFDTYFTTKPHGSGVGLGLSIVRRIIDGHGGRIYAKNRSTGGCTFYVELPVVT